MLKNRKIFTSFLAALALVSLLATPFILAEEDKSSVVADWKFGEKYAEGKIADGSLKIPDQSGAGNDLELQFYEGKNVVEEVADASVLEECLAFDSEDMDGSGDGSLVFKGDSESGQGADLITVKDAPINQETFAEGYTLEFLYRFPANWTATDAWMGLLARQITSPEVIKSMDEPELGSTSVALSSCKEIQFLTANAEDSHEMENSAWSISMDKGDTWYHIAIISQDGNIHTFINACESFRDYENGDMQGLFADPEDGRFRVGSSWYVENKDPWGDKVLDKFLQGSLQEVRISRGALAQEDWLIPHPESYVGELGSNANYSLKNNSNYTFCLIPDTQNTIKYKTEVLDQGITGLIDMADLAQVKAVISLGDVVEDNNDIGQIEEAFEIFRRLPEAGIPTLMQAGNHDGGASQKPNYRSCFSRESQEWMELVADQVINDSPSGLSSYMLVDAGSYTYLIISLSCSGSADGAHNNTAWDPADEEWFFRVLEEHPNNPTIVTSHDLQHCSDTEPSKIQFSPLGEYLWEHLRGYKQVFLLVGGHSHGSGTEVLTNDAGQEVYSILTDLQFSHNGGNAFFRFVEMDEEANKLYYSIYSPYAANLEEEERSFYDVNFLTGEGNEGEFDLNFAERFALDE